MPEENTEVHHTNADEHRQAITGAYVRSGGEVPIVDD